MNVYSNTRELIAPLFKVPIGYKIDEPNIGNGIDLLVNLRDANVPLVFFDPQYRQGLDNLSYGNEGKSRQTRRVELPQMDEETIRNFMNEIKRVLIPSGHCFLWVDKFILANGAGKLTDLPLVDMIVWDKLKMGMGYRSRHCAEYLMLFQKPPIRVKGVWKDHAIRDIWEERVPKGHPHAKPIRLQQRLIEAVTNVGDVVVDPSSGGYSVLEACSRVGRHFLGCDLIVDNLPSDLDALFN